jgi:hypothetical protein
MGDLASDDDDSSGFDQISIGEGNDDELTL